MTDSDTSRAAKLGLAWQFATAGRLTVSAFATRYDDLIDFVPDPYPHLANVAKVTSKGAAATLEMRLSPQLTTQAGVTYADTRDTETHERLLNRPLWRANVLVEWRIAEGLDARLRYGRVGARDDYATPTGPARLPAHETVALEARWRPLDRFTLTAALDNLLDDRHEDAIGFPSPGRTLRLIVLRDF